MSGYRGCYTSSCTGEGQGFALYPNKRVKVCLSHHATGCVNRLRSGLILRHKQQNADAYQSQQYEPESFHLSKTSAKIQKLCHICKYLWDFLLFIDVYAICFLRLLVFSGGLAGVGFEVLAEGELLREAQFVRHLFDQDIRLAQKVFFAVRHGIASLWREDK